MPNLTSHDGTTIAYETLGSGPAVILVDGAMCFRDSGPMRPIAQQLESQFTVYLYDRRGRGESGDTLPFAVEREIEDIDALITEAGGNASLFGLSSGAALALRAAENLGPNRINRIALYEPPFRDADDSGSAATYTAELSDALHYDRHGDAVEIFLRRVGLPGEAVAGMRQSPGWPFMEKIAPTLAYDNAAMGDTLVPVDVAKRVTVAALCMAGGASPEFLRYGATTLAGVIPNASFTMLENQTHDVSAEVIAPHLARFFSDGN